MIKSKKDLHYYLQQDKFVNGVSNSRLHRIVENFIENPSNYTFLKTLRYTEYYANVKTTFGKFFLVYYKFRLRRISKKMGYSIPINTCGPGLSIPHYGTIIINSNARIGANCRLHACVNIGASKGSKAAPQIGNNVYIGPSAVIFGDINIADNVTIGANATVNKSIDKSNVVIAGSPARIVKDNAPTWLEFNSLIK